MSSVEAKRTTLPSGLSKRVVPRLVVAVVSDELLHHRSDQPNISGAVLLLHHQLLKESGSESVSPFEILLCNITVVVRTRRCTVVALMSVSISSKKIQNNVGSCSVV